MSNLMHGVRYKGMYPRVLGIFVYGPHPAVLLTSIRMPGGGGEGFVCLFVFQVTLFDLGYLLILPSEITPDDLQCQELNLCTKLESYCLLSPMKVLTL